MGCAAAFENFWQGSLAIVLQGSLAIVLLSRGFIALIGPQFPHIQLMVRLLRAVEVRHEACGPQPHSLGLVTASLTPVVAKVNAFFFVQNICGLSISGHAWALNHLGIKEKSITANTEDASTVALHAYLLVNVC